MPTTTGYWFIFSDDRLLLSDGRLPFGTPPLPLSDDEPMEVGQMNGQPCYAATAAQPFDGTPLRQTFDRLPAEAWQLAGKARELLHWHDQTRFCGHCGGHMTCATPISKRCEACGQEVWPRLSPAIIVRIDRGNETLLVKARDFRGNYYGLVAGFVELGESLEQCVEREVFEETGLRIQHLRYFGSQPWPFPRNLMLGFTAEYASGELNLQRSELLSGSWFRRDNLPPIPGPVSLARRLIDHWLNLETP